MCDDDRYGPDCQYSGNDTCKAVNYCHGKGNCSYAGEEGLADCDCMDGYEDLFECIDLKPNRNDCKADAMRCKNGGMCIATGADASRCNCPPGKVMCVLAVGMISPSLLSQPSLGKTALRTLTCAGTGVKMVAPVLS